MKWGEDLERDCAELRRLESWGLYPHGYHRVNCPVDHEGRYIPLSECPTCGGSGEVPVNPDAAWSGHVQTLTFTACPECAS